MASLLLAASILTYNRVQDRRAAKKDRKRQGYERRYSELEREHEHEKSQTLTTTSTTPGAQQEMGREKDVQLQQTGYENQVGAEEKEMMEEQRQLRQGRDVFDETESTHSRSRSRSRSRSKSREGDRDGDRDDPASWVDGVLRERGVRA